jgi:hypothetical protein
MKAAGDCDCKRDIQSTIRTFIAIAKPNSNYPRSKLVTDMINTLGFSLTS